MLNGIRKLIPKPIFRFFQPAYHFGWAFLGAVLYGFPSRRIKIVGITGTKGKSSTAEFVNGILEAAGLRTAVLNTIRFKVGDRSRPNLYKMSMPGRLFVQKFLRQAVQAHCDWVIVEVTSEGIGQFRHKFINFDAVIFTGLEPEHIESHGSFENYLEAKLKLVKALSKSNKRPRVVVANCDSEYGERFLQYDAEEKVAFHVADTKIKPEIPGEFMIVNAGLAEAFAKQQNISAEIIGLGIASVKSIPGRVKFVKVDDSLNLRSAKQNFDVVVDYAHTPGSLEALYKTFQNRRKICVLGNTGGGRDIWKRPVMGEIASQYCDEIILTNEDPYDEDPEEIVKEMTTRMIKKPEIIMDRREAIRRAIELARANPNPSDGQSPNPSDGQSPNHQNTIVLVTGKGTDPYIMEKNGKKTPWSDEAVTREELEKVLK